MSAHLAGFIYLAVLAALVVLSVKTLAVLRGAAPWTSAGWIMTIVYGIIVVFELVTARPVAPLWPYGALGLMTAAFIVAGVKDERQADPWYWPVRLGRTRKERLPR